VDIKAIQIRLLIFKRKIRIMINKVIKIINKTSIVNNHRMYTYNNLQNLKTYQTITKDNIKKVINIFKMNINSLTTVSHTDKNKHIKNKNGILRSTTKVMR